MKSDFCDRCELPELPIDPSTIWENIPCPPPEFEEDLFSIELIDKIGPERGVSIILNIAKRCNIEVPKLFPTLGSVSGSWIFDTCGQECVSTTIAVCVSLFLVMLILTLVAFARREWGWFKKSRDQYIIEHISTMISEDETASEYKYSTCHRDRNKKIDDELSSIYVARWYKMIVGDNCSDNDQHSIYKHSTDSHCICKRLAEHIYEDIDNFKDSNECTEMLSNSYPKYCDTNNDIVLITENAKDDESKQEICCDNDSAFVSNDYQTLRAPGNNKNANDIDNQDGSVSHLRFNEQGSDIVSKDLIVQGSDMFVKEAEAYESDFLLVNRCYDAEGFGRLNSNTSAHSGTPLLNIDSTDSDSLTAVV